MRTKTTTIRLPNSMGKWVEEQARLNRRALFAQVLYTLDLVLEDWEWIYEQDQELQRGVWTEAVKTTADEDIGIETSEIEYIPISMRIPYSIFNPITKLALSLQRSANEQIVYLLKLAIEYWPTLQERRLKRSTEEKNPKEKIIPEFSILTPA